MNYEDRVTKEYVEGLLAGCGNCKIAFGYYIGTGEAGAEHPNTLRVNFTPRMLVIVGQDDNGNYHHLVAVAGEPRCHFIKFYDDQEVCNLTWGDNYVSWYGESSWWSQLNQEGSAYHYVILGE